MTPLPIQQFTAICLFDADRDFLAQFNHIRADEFFLRAQHSKALRDNIGGGTVMAVFQLLVMNCSCSAVRVTVMALIKSICLCRQALRLERSAVSARFNFHYDERGKYQHF